MRRQEYVDIETEEIVFSDAEDFHERNRHRQIIKKECYDFKSHCPASHVLMYITGERHGQRLAPSVSKATIKAGILTGEIVTRNQFYYLRELVHKGTKRPLDLANLTPKMLEEKLASRQYVSKIVLKNKEDLVYAINGKSISDKLKKDSEALDSALEDETVITRNLWYSRELVDSEGNVSLLVGKERQDAVDKGELKARSAWKSQHDLVHKDTGVKLFGSKLKKAQEKGLAVTRFQYREGQIVDPKTGAKLDPGSSNPTSGVTLAKFRRDQLVWKSSGILIPPGKIKKAIASDDAISREDYRTRKWCDLNTGTFIPREILDEAGIQGIVASDEQLTKLREKGIEPLGYKNLLAQRRYAKRKLPEDSESLPKKRQPNLPPRKERHTGDRQLQRLHSKVDNLLLIEPEARPSKKIKKITKVRTSDSESDDDLILFPKKIRLPQERDLSSQPAMKKQKIAEEVGHRSDSEDTVVIPFDPIPSFSTSPSFDSTLLPKVKKEDSDDEAPLQSSFVSRHSLFAVRPKTHSMFLREIIDLTQEIIPIDLEETHRGQCTLIGLLKSAHSRGNSTLSPFEWLKVTGYQRGEETFYLDNIVLKFSISISKTRSSTIFISKAEGREYVTLNIYVGFLLEKEKDRTNLVEVVMCPQEHKAEITHIEQHEKIFPSFYTVMDAILVMLCGYPDIKLVTVFDDARKRDFMQVPISFLQYLYQEKTLYEKAGARLYEFTDKQVNPCQNVYSNPDNAVTLTQSNLRRQQAKLHLNERLLVDYARVCGGMSLDRLSQTLNPIGFIFNKTSTIKDLVIAIVQLHKSHQDARIEIANQIFYDWFVEPFKANSLDESYHGMALWDAVFLPKALLKGKSLEEHLAILMQKKFFPYPEEFKQIFSDICEIMRHRVYFFVLFESNKTNFEALLPHTALSLQARAAVKLEAETEVRVAQCKHN